MSTPVETPRRRGLISTGRIGAIASNTLIELARMRVSHALVFFAALLIGVSVFLPNFSFEEEFQMLKDVALGAMAIFGSLLAIVATAAGVPRDLEDRTIYPILSKPVTRFEYLAGKLLGIYALLAVALALMWAIHGATLRVRVGMRAAEVAAELRAANGAEPDSGAAVGEELARLRSRAFDPGMRLGVGLLYVKACVMASITLLLATFATSSTFVMITATLVYLIGHIQGVARQLWIEGGAGGWGRDLFAGAVALVFPDLGMFDLADEIVAGAQIPGALAAGTLAMGAAYCAVYFVVAHLIFLGREL